MSIFQHVDTTPRRPVLPTGSAAFPFASPPLCHGSSIHPDRPGRQKGWKAEPNHSTRLPWNYVHSAPLLSTPLPFDTTPSYESPGMSALHHVRHFSISPGMACPDDEPLEGNSIEEPFQGVLFQGERFQRAGSLKGYSLKVLQLESYSLGGVFHVRSIHDMIHVQVCSMSRYVP